MGRRVLSFRLLERGIDCDYRYLIVFTMFMLMNSMFQTCSTDISTCSTQYDMLLNKFGGQRGRTKQVRNTEAFNSNLAMHNLCTHWWQIEIPHFVLFNITTSSRSTFRIQPHGAHFWTASNGALKSNKLYGWLSSPSIFSLLVAFSAAQRPFMFRAASTGEKFSLLRVTVPRVLANLLSKKATNLPNFVVDQ